MRVFGVLGIGLGGFILISMFMRGGPQGQGSYLMGQYFALGTGVVLLLGGLFAMSRSD